MPSVDRRSLSIFTLALCTFALAGPLAADEPRLGEIRQLTFGGENAEAYWSANGEKLIFQRTDPDGGCDQIYSLSPVDGASEMISSGEGRTTCAYYLPDGERFVYATTALHSPECPAPPDRSQGYVWPIYSSYELVLDPGDGSDLIRLTDNDFYDAEATVCPIDGRLIFTSDRDGDLELYTMLPDGSELTRITDTPGYDGGAFFSNDCTQIVWRASRPQGEALAEYQRLLKEHLVRPSKLEIWVADADGGNARQLTYFDKASFAPSFFPDGKRIIFSSNFADPGGREFDLWALNTDGTQLERITDTPGFDGFPLFSPDGTQLAFGTNRFAGGPYETNVAVAQWQEASPAERPVDADRYAADVRWLADDARDGRGIGTDGLEAAASMIAGRFEELLLTPAGDDGYRQQFTVPVGVHSGPASALAIDGQPLTLGTDFALTGFSASGAAAGEIVAAGYGIHAPDLGHDDYVDLDVSDKIVLVRRFVPPGETFDTPDAERRYGDLRYKAWVARDRGALGLLVVDLPAPTTVVNDEGVEEPAPLPGEAPLPKLHVERRGDAGIPVAVLTRDAGSALFDGSHRAEVEVELIYDYAETSNVVARIDPGAEQVHEGAIVLGAHYDHLGHGGPGSMQPDSDAIHNGADDNASGTAALLEVARRLAERQEELARPVYLVAFSGEERGLHGSTAFVRSPPGDLDVEAGLAMLNFDMVGRLRDNRVSVLGGDSAAEWSELVPPLCADLGLGCDLGGDGYGPSDQTPFYAAGLPVLHFFTGTHHDYHKPSDDSPTINAVGGARIAELAAALTVGLSQRAEPLTYQRVEAPAPASGDVRSFGASLGTIPDYVGLPEGEKGVLLAGARAGGPAEKAGIQRGDILIELAGQPIGDIYDFMFILRQAKPHQTVGMAVLRDGERVDMEVTFGESRR